MPLPQAVIEAEARANALHQAIYVDGVQPPAPAPQPAPAPAEPQPPVPPAAPAPQPPVAPEDKGLEHRYSVLKGKYDAEVPRLTEQNRNLNGRLEELTRQIAQLQTQLKEAPKPSLVKPEEVTEYGEGLVDMVRRAAREENASALATIEELRAELAQVKGGVETSNELGFYEILNRDHPDWAVINDDQQFLRWLSEPVDPMLGTETRQDVVNAAVARKDGSRVSKVVTAFKKARASWAANSDAALANQVVPTPGAPAPAPATQLQIIKRADITAHYEKQRRGQYASAAEFDAAEAAIQRAIQEGRIQ